MAFVDRENITKFSGRHIGWFHDGYVRDDTGEAVGFTENAFGGPELPPTRPISIEAEPKTAPIPPLTRIWPAPPIFGKRWSPRPLNQFFKGALL